MSIEHEPIFPAAERGVAFHNIGLNGVLDSIDENIAEKVHRKYQYRGGHIPEAEEIGILVTDSSSENVDHVNYLSQLYGKQVMTFTPEQLERESGSRDTLVVPYIRTPKADTLITRTGSRVWGLPPELVNAYKNKAVFHGLASELGNERYKVPNDFTICEISEVAAASYKVLVRAIDSYQKAGLSSYEPLGIIARASEADGGYGSVMVTLSHGRVHVLLDGELDLQSPGHDNSESGWKEAFEKAQLHFSRAMDANKERRVVVSRLMDLADSPGLSAFILNGEMFSLGWNGQLQAAGGNACIGTSHYRPKTKLLEDALNKYESATAQGFGEFVLSSARALGNDPHKITGIINTDIMIPGEYEIAYQKALNNPEPDAPTIAEINPRLTNFSDGVLAVARIQGREQTVANMRQVIAEGITMIDRYRVPLGISIEQVREIVMDLDYQLRGEAARIVLRMPTTPEAGLIVVGNADHVISQLNQTLLKVAI